MHIINFPKISSNQLGDTHISNALSKLLDIADNISKDYGDSYISSEFFFLDKKFSYDLVNNSMISLLVGFSLVSEKILVAL